MVGNCSSFFFLCMDTLGTEPRAFRMRSGCDTTTPCAPEKEACHCPKMPVRYSHGCMPDSCTSTPPPARLLSSPPATFQSQCLRTSRDLPVASLSSYILLSLWGPGDAISISVPISITAQLGHLVRHCLHPFSPTIPPHSDYFPSPQHKYLQVPLLTHLGWSQAQVTPTASPLTSLLPLTDPRRLVPPTGRHRWPPAL